MTPADWGAVAALSGTIGVVVTKAFDLLASRYRDHHKDEFDDRAQLLEESRELRRQILEDLARARADIDACSQLHEECVDKLTNQALRITELERMVIILRAAVGALPE